MVLPFYSASQVEILSMINKHDWGAFNTCSSCSGLKQKKGRWRSKSMAGWSLSSCDGKMMLRGRKVNDCKTFTQFLVRINLRTNSISKKDIWLIGNSWRFNGNTHQMEQARRGDGHQCQFGCKILYSLFNICQTAGFQLDQETAEAKHKIVSPLKSTSRGQWGN